MKNLKSIIQRESIMYIAIFFVVSIISHSDLLSDPLARFQMMTQKENYAHPFIYTFFIYTVILIIRKILDLITWIFEKK